MIAASSTPVIAVFVCQSGQVNGGRIAGIISINGRKIFQLRRREGTAAGGTVKVKALICCQVIRQFRAFDRCWDRCAVVKSSNENFWFCG